MTELALSNLIAWSVQAALLAVIAALVAGAVRIDAPAVRYAWWRVVLVAVLVLPAVQPWQPVGLLPVELLPAAELPPEAVTAPDSGRISSPGTPAAPPPTRLQLSAAVAGTLLAGVLLRVAWVFAGLWRLRRLRTAGTSALTPDASEALRAIGEAGADARYVEGLQQPVTFGIRRPVVLLPQRLATMPPSIQRAVLVHELWHVRRRDWTWSLTEEALRAALWFHPAIWYLVGRVQSSREEVVDELSVLSTNARKSYLEALLAFADAPGLHPATPFARRRHLFTRMLLISREAVMSPRRIVCSGAAMAGALLLAGWYGSLAFPLTADTGTSAAGSIPPPARLLAAPAPGAMIPRTLPPEAAVRSSDVVQGQAQPRDPRPAARVVTSREQELQTAVRNDPANVGNWLTLARLQVESRALDDAAATLQEALGATQSREVLLMLARVYNQLGQFDKSVATLEDAAARDAGDPAGHQLVAVHYWEKAQKDTSLTPAEKADYLQRGIAATDRAIGLKPDYIEALTYKNILLRMQANLEPDPSRRQALLTEADGLRTRAMELNKARTAAGGVAGMPGAPPPPPPPFPPTVDGQPPLRVGGDIKTPAKIHDVRPVYPAEAQEARVSGMVIVEALIGGDGNVRQARVLRSVPLLDQAALDAVQQWRFNPTLLNGVPVPVIMTVTVNFTLQ